MSINGSRRLGDTLLPQAGPTLGGVTTLASSVAYGSTQHPGLPTRPSQGSGCGAAALRVGIAKLPHVSDLGHALDGIRADLVGGVQQLASSAGLQGSYSTVALVRAVGVAVDRLVQLKQEGLA